MGNADAGEFYDVKFYPYSPPGSSPVFAIVSQKQVGLYAPSYVVSWELTVSSTQVLVGRVIQTRDHPVEIIRIISEDDVRAPQMMCLTFSAALLTPA